MSKLITFDDSNIMSFGFHKGKKLGDVPDSYIKWCMENDVFREDFKADTERGSIARYFKLAYDSMLKR